MREMTIVLVPLFAIAIVVLKYGQSRNARGCSNSLFNGILLFQTLRLVVLFFFSAVKFQSLGLPKRRVTSGVPKVFLRIARKTILFEQKT